MSPTDPDQCTHPPAKRRLEEREHRGLKLRVEVCQQCGRELVHPAEANRALNRRGPRGSPTLSANEVVLALLGVFPSRPIISRVSMMKEAFLLEKETAPAVGVSTVGLDFVPYRYGPYSPSVDAALERLVHDGMITVTKDRSGRKETFSLTKPGLARARELVDQLSSAQVETLRRKRQGWDQLGQRGLLRKVYQEYPAYKSKSEIAERVKPKRRWT